MAQGFIVKRVHEQIEEVVELAGRRLSILRPPSADELIDEAAVDEEEFLPYWAELWPSGLALAGQAQAAEPDACHTVRMANVGWTDNFAQNGLFRDVLKGLGYKYDDKEGLALPVILERLKNKDLDLFLDKRMPSNAPTQKPYTGARLSDVSRTSDAAEGSVQGRSD